MKATTSPIYLAEVSTGDGVAAELLDQIEEEHLQKWECDWRPWHSKERLEKLGIPREKWPQNKHWDWRRKAEVFRGILAYPGFCIICRETVQGFMIVNLTKSARLEEQKEKPLVYVEFLETAPWNRPDLQKPPTYRGVGGILIGAAINLSIAEGFKGRIGLHSLPQSNNFYSTKCGMTDLGPDPDPNHQGLRYFEMTTQQAQTFLEKGQ